ncbi:MAG: elongation factor P [Sphingomonadales bacterium]
MKINGNEIRPGNVIVHQDGLWRAVKTDHVKPGKGPAYLQVELKNLRDGRKLNERFRSSETVERVRLEQKDYQYLFEADGKYTFMDTDTYDQVEINASLLGDSAVYLQDGMQVTVEAHDGAALGVVLPDQVVLEVTDTEPVVKGQTAASSNKPAIMENGVRVMVPPFVSIGDRVLVNTEDSTYIRRAD